MTPETERIPARTDGAWLWFARVIEPEGWWTTPSYMPIVIACERRQSRGGMCQECGLATLWRRQQ